MPRNSIGQWNLEVQSAGLGKPMKKRDPIPRSSKKMVHLCSALLGKEGTDEKTIGLIETQSKA